MPDRRAVFNTLKFCLKFHNKRDANPEKFQSRLFNKTQYAKIGLQKMFFDRTCKDMWKRIELEVDQVKIDLPNIEGIIVLNLLSYGSGSNPWGTSREDGAFSKPTHYDGLLEVVGISDVSRLGLIQSKLAAGIRIAQGEHIRITTHEEWPVQVDGEPHIQPAGTIIIMKSALKAQMLRKPIRRRGGAHNKTSQVCAPLASPEHDGMFYSKFDIGRNIGRRIDKSLGRFARRHSLGREKKKSPVAKDSHSAVEYEHHSNTSNEI